MHGHPITTGGSLSNNNNNDDDKASTFCLAISGTQYVVWQRLTSGIMSGVISKKLKFKGDKPKKKKRSHKDIGGDEDELAAMAAADPRGMLEVPFSLWIFTTSMFINEELID